MASNGHAQSIQQSGMKRPHSADPPRASKRPSSQDGQLSVTVRAVGQTAPRLISTLKTADRQHYIDNERNPFIHPPRGYDEQFDATRRQPLHTPCKHFWTTQRNQTVLPESDIADSGQVYRLACFCQNCRWHVDLQIQHTAQPCPKQDYPLHHFTEFERDHEPEEWYRARCSGCAAQIRVDYRRPRLHSEQIDMLINVDKLQQRLKAAQQTDPDRNHTKAASPIEVLDALATYLRDAFASSDEKKIPKMNRRFLTSFGDDCKDLLASMGFKDIGEFYRLPQPEPPEPWAWGLRKQLEDTQEELWALMRQLKSNDESLNLEKVKGYNGNMEPFEEDAQLFLSTFEYDKSKTTRRAPTLTLDEQSWYAGLGCLGDFSDDLISFGFDRQIFTDKDNAPYYFDCLVAIAKKRKSETLEMKMVMLESEGHYGRQDVVNAYKYFTLDPRQANELTDLYIRGVFESRIESIPKASEAEAREKLRLIGVARGSQALLEAASNEISDHQSALRFLDPAYNESNQYTDDWIITLANVKTSENADTYWFQKVHKAVELIANHRNSAALRRYLATGEATTTDEDELAAAYRFYNISDRTSSIDVEALGLQLQLLIDDNDESKDRKARATKYFELLKANTKSTPPVVMAPDYNKPVGLENLHNFCYLHSLLQFFFAILVFRETILNFDDFKQAIEELVDTDLGKIGGEAVTKSRVEDGYKLVQQLHELFTRLHQAPGPSIQVATDLAAGALQAPPAEAKLVPATVIETAAAESSPESETVRGDESSDITLIGDAIMTPESETDEQQTTDAGNTEQTSAGGNDDSKKDDNDKSGPPNRPPPVPPRPKKPDEIADLYAQHDAYQVLSNVIQKTMASIAPTSIDSKGERHDRIRDLFYGVTQQLCTTNSKRHEAFDLSYNTHQFIYLAAKPKDVQEGLDIDFGREELETGEWERYKVMTEAPPMLQLYIQNRVDVSGESGFKSERIDHNMELNETIQLDRYMKENQEQMLPLRTKSWDLRDRLNELTGDGKKHKIKLGGKQDPVVELDSDESFTALIAALKSDREDNLLDEKTEELIQQLNGAAESDFHVKADREKEIPELRAKLNAIDLSICDTKDLRYRIFAIFMYNGSGFGGHWWIYIRDFKNNVWRSYNDAIVTVVSEEEVFRKRDPMKEPAASLVVYVKDDKKDELCDPLHRIKPETEADDDGDLDMGWPSNPNGAEIEVREVEMMEIKSLLD